MLSNLPVWLPMACSNYDRKLILLTNLRCGVVNCFHVFHFATNLKQICGCLAFQRQWQSCNTTRSMPLWHKIPPEKNSTSWRMRACLEMAFAFAAIVPRLWFWQCVWTSDTISCPFQRAHGVVVSNPLCMRKALGSIPSVSNVYVVYARCWSNVGIIEQSTFCNFIRD